MNEAQAFWQLCHITLPDGDPAHEARYVAGAFGDSPRLGQELADIIVAGRKTALCSAMRERAANVAALPQVGLRTDVLDGGEPVCVIETTEVTMRQYNAVDARFAADEGESNLTLDHWLVAHARYFSRSRPIAGRELVEDTPLLCKRLRVVYGL